MTSKKRKLDVRDFQDSWTIEFRFVKEKDRSVCELYCKIVVCRTSSVQRHFQTKHQTTFKDSDEKFEVLERSFSRYEKEVTFLCQAIGVQPKAAECSFVIDHCLAAKGKPFTDGEHINNTFCKSAEILFSSLLNLQNTVS
ncbi:uncharacterized protein TNCV_458511 [Trichonephila clavipes]|nr:uncharacterized protein TNCV_458511 [Trichonephila clavipes]